MVRLVFQRGIIVVSRAVDAVEVSSDTIVVGSSNFIATADTLNPSTGEKVTSQGVAEVNVGRGIFYDVTSIDDRVIIDIDSRTAAGSVTKMWVVERVLLVSVNRMRATLEPSEVRATTNTMGIGYLNGFSLF